MAPAGPGEGPGHSDPDEDSGSGSSSAKDSPSDAPRPAPARETPRKRRRNASPVQEDVNVEGTGSVGGGHSDNFDSLLSVGAAPPTHNPPVHESPTPASRGRHGAVITGAVNEGDYASPALNPYIDQASLFDDGTVNDAETPRKRARRNVRVTIRPEDPVVGPSTPTTAAAPAERTQVDPSPAPSHGRVSATSGTASPNILAGYQAKMASKLASKKNRKAKKERAKARK